MMFGVGVVSATAPPVAQAKGARQPRQISAWCARVCG